MLQPADFSSLDDVENYAEYSQSSLLYLMLEAMNIKHEPTEYAASHVGVCHGILILLKAHAYHASQVCIMSERVWSFPYSVSGCARASAISQKKSW